MNNNISVLGWIKQAAFLCLFVIGASPLLQIPKDIKPCCQHRLNPGKNDALIKQKKKYVLPPRKKLKIGD